MSEDWKKDFPRFYLKKDLRGLELYLAGAPETDQYGNYIITCINVIPTQATLDGKIAKPQTRMIKTKVTALDLTHILELDDEGRHFSFEADATTPAFTNVVAYLE